MASSRPKRLPTSRLQLVSLQIGMLRCYRGPLRPQTFAASPVSVSPSTPAQQLRRSAPVIHQLYLLARPPLPASRPAARHSESPRHHTGQPREEASATTSTSSQAGKVHVSFALIFGLICPLRSFARDEPRFSRRTHQFVVSRTGFCRRRQARAASCVVNDVCPRCFARDL